MTTLPLLVREGATGLAVVALVVAAAGVLIFAWARRATTTAAQRQKAGTAIVVAAGALLLVLLLLAGGDRPEPFLPLVAALLCGVAPVRGVGVRAGVQVVAVGGAVVALIQAGRPPEDVVLPLALLVSVAIVANALAFHLASVRDAAALARQAGIRRGHLLATVRELAGSDPEAAAGTACLTLVDHGYDTAAVVLEHGDELFPLEHTGDLDARQLLSLAGERITAAVAADRTHVIAEVGHDVEDGRGGIGSDGIPSRGIGSGVIVPIRVDGRPSGALVGVRAAPQPLAPSDLEGAEVMAAHLGVTLSTAARVRRQRELLDRMSQLDRMRTGFVAEVSEELRHPLTVVRGIGQTLVSHDPAVSQEHRRQLLQRIGQQTKQLGTTIDALLDFSRFQARRAPPAVTSVAIGELLHPVVMATGAELEGPSEPLVEVDAALVRHALELLLGGDGRGTGRVLRIRAGAPLTVELVDLDGRDVPVFGIVRSLAAKLLVLGGARLQPERPIVILPSGGLSA